MEHTLVVLAVFLMILGYSISMGAGIARSAETGSAQLSASTSLQENLAALKGKTVTVSLASGQTITGIVDEVQGNLLHLSRISQREFYDALVVVDRISAIETKVR